MTTAMEGAELTRVGPGTVMGELMRQYWIPAMQSSELERDGAPIRLMLLGEKLIAFRDSAGRVGVGPSLPASLRLIVPGTQRGRRDPLHLSWLEIRRFRQLRRHGERAGAPGFQAQGEGQGLSRGRARRDRLGPYGGGRQGAAAAGARDS